MSAYHCSVLYTSASLTSAPWQRCGYFDITWKHYFDTRHLCIDVINAPEVINCFVVVLWELVIFHYTMVPSELSMYLITWLHVCWNLCRDVLVLICTALCRCFIHRCADVLYASVLMFCMLMFCMPMFCCVGEDPIVCGTSLPGERCPS